MKTLQLSLILALCAFVSISCDKETDNTPKTVTINKLTATCAAPISFDSNNENGVYLANGWSENSEISIIDENATCIGILSTSKSGKTLDFTGSVDVVIGGYYLAVYPSIAVGNKYTYDTTSKTLTLTSSLNNLQAIEKITNFYPESFYITKDGKPNKTIEFMHRYTFFTLWTNVPNDNNKKAQYENILKHGNKLSLYAYDEGNEDLFRASINFDKSSNDPNTSLLGYLENSGANYATGDTPSNKLYVAVNGEITEQSLRWVLEDTSGTYDPIYVDEATTASYEMGEWKPKFITGSSWKPYVLE